MAAINQMLISRLFEKEYSKINEAWEEVCVAVNKASNLPAIKNFIKNALKSIAKKDWADRRATGTNDSETTFENRARELLTLPVMKRTYKKCISMETDVRTQIALRSDEIENSKLTLLKIAENAPSDKRGGKRIIDVPLGVEAINQYNKKALMLMYDYQADKRAMLRPSSKKTKELLDSIKKYERGLVYGQVQTNDDRAAHCVIGDSYKSGELIKMLRDFWVSDSETGLRDVLSTSHAARCSRLDKS